MNLGGEGNIDTESVMVFNSALTEFMLSRGRWRKWKGKKTKRIKMQYAYVPVPHDECINIYCKHILIKKGAEEKT